MVVFGASDTREAQTFIQEIHDAYAERGTTRDVGVILMWARRPKGILVEVRSSDDPCASNGLRMSQGMAGLGFGNVVPVIETSVHASEIHVLAGDP